MRLKFRDFNNLKEFNNYWGKTHDEFVAIEKNGQEFMKSMAESVATGARRLKITGFI